MIDHAIQDYKVLPVIIVCPTYNNTSMQDNSDFSLALLLTSNYHNELVNDLIPAIESSFATYGENTSKERLMTSRDNRAFGGFSMGSVTTWRTFEADHENYEPLRIRRIYGSSEFEGIV